MQTPVIQFGLKKERRERRKRWLDPEWHKVIILNDGSQHRTNLVAAFDMWEREKLKAECLMYILSLAYNDFGSWIQDSYSICQHPKSETSSIATCM